MTTLARKIGRNAPCRCGSGKKSKVCCGAQPAQRLVAAHGKREVNAPAVAILMPTRGKVSIETLVATANLDGLPATLLPCARKGIIEARNTLAQEARQIPARAPYHPLGGWFALWVDDDAFWYQGTLTRLLQPLVTPEIDIIAGWFSGRVPNSGPKCFREDGSFPKPGMDCDEGSVVEVASVGFHFVAHRLSLLKEMGDNPFTPEGTSEKGEDMAFCERARALGKRIWVHTGCPIAHVDGDGLVYLPGEGPMRVEHGSLVKVDRVRDYGDLQPA